MSSGSEFDFDAVSDNEEEKKKDVPAFADEDTVDADALEKKKKEELKKKKEEEEKLNAREKKSNKVDLDKLFNERQKKLGNVTELPKTIDTTGMTATQKAQALEQAAEKNLQAQLFGDDEEESKTIILTNDEEYKKYGQNVANVLYAGTTPYNIEKFYRELGADIGKHTDYKNIKKIAELFTSLAASKLKEEKAEKAKLGVGKKEKVQLKGGTGKAYEMNNNKAMINDVMGDYGDDDDYGNEGFNRENEAQYDFM